MPRPLSGAMLQSIDAEPVVFQHIRDILYNLLVQGISGPDFIALRVTVGQIRQRGTAGKGKPEGCCGKGKQFEWYVHTMLHVIYHLRIY